jgi:hypothetical protein
MRPEDLIRYILAKEPLGSLDILHALNIYSNATLFVSDKGILREIWTVCFQANPYV